MREYTTDFAPWDLIMSSDISNGGGLYASVAFGGVVAILAWMMFFLSGKELNDILTWRIVKLLTGGVDMRARRRATQHFRVTRCTWIEASTDDEVRARERERKKLRISTQSPNLTSRSQYREGRLFFPCLLPPHIPRLSFESHLLFLAFSSSSRFHSISLNHLSDALPEISPLHPGQDAVPRHHHQHALFLRGKPLAKPS